MTSFENECVTEILKDLGWDMGISIPMANEENKLLCQRLSNLKKSNTLKNDEISSLIEKVNVLSEHKRNARIERSNCESVISTIKNNTKTEKHFCHLSERELGRLKQEIVKTKTRIDEIMERTNYYENQNHIKSMELEEIKTVMQLDQKSMEVYLAECNHQEDLAKYLNLYTREDYSKTAMMNHEVSKLIDKRIKLRKKLDEQVIETKIIQIELDKTAEQYRQEHASRDEVLQMWRHTISQLQIRDSDIKKAGEELANHRVKLRALDQELAEKRELAKSIETDNTGQEKEIAKLDNEIAFLKSEYQEKQKIFETINRENEVLKTTIRRIGKDTEIARGTIKNLRAERQVEKEKLSYLSDKVKYTTQRWQEVKEAAQNSDIVLTHAEDLLSEEQLYRDSLNAEMHKLRDRQFAINRKFLQHTEALKNQQAAVHTCISTVRNLCKNKAKCEEELIKMDELLYKTEMNIQSWEHRIAVLEGDTTGVEMQKELRVKIDLLTAELTHLNMNLHQLREMNKRFNNDTSILRMNLEKKKKMKVSEHDKLVAEDLAIETSIRMLKKVKKLREEELIFRNMEKLQLKKLETRCRDIINQVTDLEIRKTHLDAITNDRRTEIRYYKEILRKNLIMVEKEKSDAYKQMQELDGKLKKTITKYQIISNDKTIDEMAGLKHTVETAIAKEEMQRYGDKLDGKLRLCQKEIHALENTVVLLNSSNESFRQTLIKANPHNEEDYQKKEQLENELKAQEKALQDCRSEKRLLLKDLQFVKDELEKSQLEEQEEIEKIGSLKILKESRHEEIRGLKEKISRAKTEYGNLLSSLNLTSNELGNIQIKVQSVLNELYTSEVCQILNRQYPDIWTEAGRSFLENAKIPIPLQWKTQKNNSHNIIQVGSASSIAPSSSSMTNSNAIPTNRSSSSSKFTNQNKATASLAILDLSAAAALPLDNSQQICTATVKSITKSRVSCSSNSSSSRSNNHASDRSKTKNKSLHNK